MVGPAAIDERSGPGPNPAIGRSASSVPERERRPEIKPRQGYRTTRLYSMKSQSESEFQDAISRSAGLQHAGVNNLCAVQSPTFQ